MEHLSLQTGKVFKDTLYFSLNSTQGKSGFYAINRNSHLLILFSWKHSERKLQSGDLYYCLIRIYSFLLPLYNILITDQLMLRLQIHLPPRDGEASAEPFRFQAANWFFENCCYDQDCMDGSLVSGMRPLRHLPCDCHRLITNAATQNVLRNLYLDRSVGIFRDMWL